MHPGKDPTDRNRTIVPSGSVTQTVAQDLPQHEVAAVGEHSGDKLRLGTRLGEFEITALVGEGGFSIVYLAWDHSLERRVALKEYFPSSLAVRIGGSQVSARSSRHRDTFEVGLRSFVNEGKLLAQFDHPALVKVYRFWEAHGTAYMVMPFYEGTTLRETVRSMREPPDEAWLMALLGPLTEALRVIHAVQCFHRDIAPDNVMLLLPSARPLLLDFGAARRVIGDRTQALTVILKPGYAPIEQYAEDIAMKQGPWTDVYALAAVVYWSITGRTPPVAVGRMLDDGFVPLARCAVGRYSIEFLQAVDRALAVLPEHRTQSIEQFRRELGLDRQERPASESTVAWVDPEKTVVRPASARGPLPAQAPAPARAEPARPVRKDDAPARANPARAIRNDDAPTVLRVPPARPGRRRSSAIAATLAGVIASGAAVWWWSSRPPDTGVASSTPTADRASTQAPSASGPQTTASSAVAPAPVEPAAGAGGALTTATALERLHAERDPSFALSATAAAASRGSMLRIQFRATEAGHAYVLAVTATGDRLRLLHPASVDASRRSNPVAQVDVPAAAVEPGTRLALVLSRERRQFASAGWAMRQGVMSLEVEGMPVATTTADALLGPALCAASSTRCDPAFGMTEVTLMTNVTPPLTRGAGRADERAARAPTYPIDDGAATSNRAADGVATEGKPAPRRDAGQAAECARILQRMSLGETSAELIERMKTLRCS